MKYQFETDIEIDYCVDCPCFDSENGCCNLDRDEMRDSPERPSWCRLVEVEEE